MRQDMLKQAAVYHKEHRQKVKRYKIFSALAAAVVFCTTVVLIMPAATMEKPLVCGFEEHVHTEECQGTESEVLVCGLEESESGGHVHGDECYETAEVKTLTCGLEESEAAADHTGEPVHETAKVKTLTCGLEEAEAVEGHTHDESCYTEEPVYETQTVTVEDTETQDVLDEEGNVVDSETVVVGSHEEEIQVQVGTDEVLTCGLEEAGAVEGHTHDESCYTEEPVNETQDVPDEEQEEAAGHTHTDDCYTVEIEETLVCTEEEGQIEGHVHSEDCYETQMVYACGLEEHEHTDECRQPPHENDEDCYITVKTLACGMEESEEHTHDDSCYTEEQVLIGTEGEEPAEEEPAEEPKEAAPVDLTETFENRYYQAVFHVVYNGGMDEEDVLAFTACTTGSDEMEGIRDYEYLSLIPDSKIFPMGRTEFALTLNGETVDRDSYNVYVEVIPSRESVAFLAMAQSGGMDSMMLDLYDDEDYEVSVEVVSGFTLYELVNGELAQMGRVEADLENLDLNSYMAYAYDENGNPAYDGNYTVWAEVYGEDFMIAAGTEYKLIKELVAITPDTRYANQGYWWMNVENHVTVWWQGFEPSGKAITYKEANVANVYLTHFNSTTGQTTGDQNEILQAVINEGIPSQQEGGVLLTTVFPDALPKEQPGKDAAEGEQGKNDNSDTIYPDAYDYEEVENPDEATHMLVEYPDHSFPDALLDRSSGEWDNLVFQKENFAENGGRITFYKQTFADRPNEGHDFALLEIEPEPGYYVTQVVITCCYNKQGTLTSPYTECKVYESGNAFRQSFSVAEGSSVSLVVDSESFCHANTDEAGHTMESHSYYIMIETAPIPSPLYVEYNLGNDGLKAQFANYNTWVSGTATQTGSNISSLNGNVSWKITKSGANDTWANGDLVFTAGTLKQEVIDYARNILHLEFDGWELKYYSAASENGANIRFDEPFNQDSLNVMYPGEKRELLTHAELVARWVDIPVATITKEVTGLGENDNEARTFRFSVNGSDQVFTVKMTVNKLVNGVYQDVEEVQEVTDGTFTMTVRGNGRQSCRIYGLDNGSYVVEETNPGEAKVSYSVDNVSGSTFTVEANANQVSEVLVTNSYSSAPTTFDLTVQKVTGTKDAGTPTTEWAALSGAEFELYLVDEDGDTLINGSIIPINNTNTNATAEVKELSFDTLYKLVETRAPAGYDMLADPIYFKATADGIVLCDENGTVKDDDEFAAAAEEFILVVANYGGYVLPSTGGPGTTLYALGGMLFMLAAAFLMYKNLRERGRAVA